MQNKFYLFIIKNIYANYFPQLGWHLLRPFFLQLCDLVFLTDRTVVYGVLYPHLYSPSILVLVKQPCLLNFHVVTVLLSQYLQLQLRWHYYLLAFHGYSILYGQLMSDGQIFFVCLVTHLLFCAANPV